jgi:hypothetical protein
LIYFSLRRKSTGRTDGTNEPHQNTFFVNGVSRTRKKLNETFSLSKYHFFSRAAIRQSLYKEQRKHLNLLKVLLSGHFRGFLLRMLITSLDTVNLETQRNNYIMAALVSFSAHANAKH